MNKFSELITNYEDHMWPKFRDFVKKQFHIKYILADKIFFDWQYKKCPYNHYTGAAMKTLQFKNKFLGFLGLIPVELSVNGQVVKRASALCNLMIAPECRAFGLGSYFVQAAVDDFDIMWGTGYHPKTGPMYTGLKNWHLAGDLNRYIIILNPTHVETLIGHHIDGKITKLYLNNDSVSDFVVEEIKRFDEQIDIFWGQICRKYTITVNRTADYLNWRYVDHPYFQYRVLVVRRKEDRNTIAGYLVFRITESSGLAEKHNIAHIVDLIAEDCTEKSLISKCLELSKIANVDLVDYFCTGLFHKKSLFDLGFELDNVHPFDLIPIYFNPVDFKRRKINFLIYSKELDLLKRDMIMKSSNWYITKGDGDKDRPNPH
jgi:hypothetical protein